MITSTVPSELTGKLAKSGAIFLPWRGDPPKAGTDASKSKAVAITSRAGRCRFQPALACAVNRTWLTFILVSLRQSRSWGDQHEGFRNPTLLTLRCEPCF